MVKLDELIAFKVTKAMQKEWRRRVGTRGPGLMREFIEAYLDRRMMIEQKPNEGVQYVSRKDV